MPALRSVRLLDQVRERVRSLHYSLSTERADVRWVRIFVRWHGRDGSRVPLLLDPRGHLLRVVTVTLAHQKGRRQGVGMFVPPLAHGAGRVAEHQSHFGVVQQKANPFLHQALDGIVLLFHSTLRPAGCRIGRSCGWCVHDRPR